MIVNNINGDIIDGQSNKDGSSLAGAGRESMLLAGGMLGSTPDSISESRSVI